MAQKLCKRCNKYQPLTEFHRQSQAKDGLRYYCRKCMNKYDREHYARSKNRRFNRYIDASKRKTGITKALYESLMKKQKGVCAICGSDSYSKRSKRLGVDHCHNSKIIRGLLCGKCNIGLGQFSDNPILLRKAVLYLEKPIILPVENPE